MELIVLVEY